jgi:hypothetical protein
MSEWKMAVAVALVVAAAAMGQTVNGVWTDKLYLQQAPAGESILYPVPSHGPAIEIDKSGDRSAPYDSLRFYGGDLGLYYGPGVVYAPGIGCLRWNSDGTSILRDGPCYPSEPKPAEPLPWAEREELERLRKEVEELRAEFIKLRTLAREGGWLQ